MGCCAGERCCSDDNDFRCLRDVSDDDVLRDSRGLTRMRCVYFCREGERLRVAKNCAEVGRGLQCVIYARKVSVCENAELVDFFFCFFFLSV